MTVTLTFRPEVEAGLLARAQNAGMTLEQYLLSVVEGVVLPAAPGGTSPGERADAFEAWSASHRATPPLSGYAVSREAMYEGRERVRLIVEPLEDDTAREDRPAALRRLLAGIDGMTFFSQGRLPSRDELHDRP